jgi:uncharacterized membrane protein
MYQLAAFVHLLAAMVWIGGMLFLAVVLVPVARGLQDPPGVGMRFLGQAARRFRFPAWGALLVLVATGIWLLVERGIGVTYLLEEQGSIAGALRIKLALVVAVVALSALHDFGNGPRVARLMQAGGRPSASALQQRRLLTWLARVNVALVLVIAALGVMVVRGVP